MDHLLLMETHKPYEQLFGHKEDFKVNYRFYSGEEGGRYSLPHQGIRSDFWYESSEHQLNGFFMIYPEFEDECGNLIEGIVNREDIARMWIVNTKNRSYHQQRIKIGPIGYFREGMKRTGICEVVEIVSLHENPVN